MTVPKDDPEPIRLVISTTEPEMYVPLRLEGPLGPDGYPTLIPLVDYLRDMEDRIVDRLTPKDDRR